MTNMNVQEFTDRIKRLYPKITEATKRNWDKAIKRIKDVKVVDVNDDVAREYLEDGMELWSESTVKQRIGFLKGIWIKGYKKKLYKGENPWLDLDDGLEVKRRDPELHPWEFYEYYHADPYFVCLWYTGMRIGELAGIYPENIHIDAQIPYFDLKHQENRRLKNNESIRQVPIHPAALPFAERLYFSKDKTGPGRSWSESFRENLALPKGDGAHSLRHSFTTRMREADSDEYVLDRLLGHKIHSKTGRYGKIRLDVLDRELQKLR
jgi:integrase